MNTTRTNVLRLLLPAALLVILAPAQGMAQLEYLFEAEISGAYEVPPTTAPQTGLVTLTLNEAQTQAVYVIEYDDLPNETAAHFHLASPGQNGGVVLGLPAGNPKIGVWEISAAHVEALFAGNIYVNIHTSEFPGGAIRGNLTSHVVPVEPATWELVKSLFR